MAGEKEHVMVRGQRDIVVKAFEIGNSIESSSTRHEPDDQSSAFDRTNALEPPYDPEILASLLEVSNSLRQNVDAYAVNIDGFGHRFEPSVALDEEDASQVISDIITIERLHAAELNGEDPDIEDIIPSDDEVEDKKKRVRRLMRIEQRKLRSFFAFAAQGESFPKLRKRTRHDLEVTGNAYWEVLRNDQGKLARFVYVPTTTMRLRPCIKEPVEVEERFPISPISFTTVKVVKQFRTFVQVTDDVPVFFKQYGDPRTVSRCTGEVFDSDEALRKAEPKSQPANEIIHFCIPSPRSPYGVPRWIGALISVLGSRAAEEVNFFYFENKAVPPLAILVSGGRLSKSSVPRIEDFIENNIKGKRNFHKVMIIEAVSPGGKATESGPHPPRPMIELRPLMEAQLQDALFQNYDERNIDKVGGSFRLPRLLRGESKDFNRATAEAALRMAEEQVFQPERDDFDFFINTAIIPVVGAKFHSFRSNAPVTRDPETMGKIVTAMVEKGILTPAEGRMLAGDIFNTDFAVINQPWAKQPISFTLAGIQTGQVAAGKTVTSGALASGGALGPAQGSPPKIPSITDDDPEKLAQMLLRIRSAMGKAEEQLEHERLASERPSDGELGDVITLEVSREVMDSWVEQDSD